MGSKIQTEIHKYMLENIKDHVDPLTGEVNDTGLAEDAIWNSGIEFDEELFFTIAARVATRYEIQTGVRQPPAINLISQYPSDYF